MTIKQVLGFEQALGTMAKKCCFVTKAERHCINFDEVLAVSADGVRIHKIINKVFTNNMQEFCMSRIRSIMLVFYSWLKRVLQNPCIFPPEVSMFLGANYKKIIRLSYDVIITYDYRKLLSQRKIILRFFCN